jgi:hypothetical protein
MSAPTRGTLSSRRPQTFGLVVEDAVCASCAAAEIGGKAWRRVQRGLQ